MAIPGNFRLRSTSPYKVHHLDTITKILMLEGCSVKPPFFKKKKRERDTVIYPLSDTFKIFFLVLVKLLVIYCIFTRVYYVYELIIDTIIKCAYIILIN